MFLGPENGVSVWLGPVNKYKVSYVNLVWLLCSNESKKGKKNGIRREEEEGLPWWSE